MMITHRFEARVRRVGSTDVDIPVDITLAYDADADPYAVQAVFEIPDEEDRVWYFGRELLVAGMYSRVPFGRGDVKFRYFETPGVLMLCLKSGGHGPEEPTHADIALPHAEVRRFVDDTWKSFKGSAGNCTALVDEFLKEVLG